LVAVVLEQLAQVMELLALIVFFLLLHPPVAVVVDKITQLDYRAVLVVAVVVLM
jgi:hypothetical protein